jgi:hypothetical protein
VVAGGFAGVGAAAALVVDEGYRERIIRVKLALRHDFKTVHPFSEFPLDS